MFRGWQFFVFPFDATSICIARLADLTFTLPHIVEWDCMDDIFRIALENCLDHIDSYGQMSTYNAVKWNKIFTLLLTWVFPLHFFLKNKFSIYLPLRHF